MELHGYHGTDNSSAKDIIEQQNIKPSEGLDVWLGKGRYFFVCFKDATWWCQQRRYPNPKVVLAHFHFENKIIDLVSDIDDQKYFYQYCDKVKNMSENLPDPFNRRRRNYMQLAMEKLLKDAKNAHIQIDATKALFLENRKFWDFNSCERWKFPCIIAQVQICVYNKDSIKSLELCEEAM